MPRNPRNYEFLFRHRYYDPDMDQSFEEFVEKFTSNLTKDIQDWIIGNELIRHNMDNLRRNKKAEDSDNSTQPS